MNLPEKIRDKLTPFTELVLEETLDRGQRQALLDVSVTVAPSDARDVSQRLRSAGLVIDSQLGDQVLGRIEASAVTGLAQLPDVRQIEVSHRAQMHAG